MTRKYSHPFKSSDFLIELHISAGATTQHRGSRICIDGITCKGFEYVQHGACIRHIERYRVRVNGG